MKIVDTLFFGIQYCGISSNGMIIPKLNNIISLEESPFPHIISVAGLREIKNQLIIKARSKCRWTLKHHLGLRGKI